MHKIFGIKEAVEYADREGAYVVPIRNKKVGVVKTPKGYFFLGGGLQDGESHIECIKRECVEEAGYSVLVKCEVCSAETYINHPTLGYFHPIQTYYTGDVLFKEAEPKEKDHTFIWVDYDEIKGKMFVKMQNWALERIFEYTSKN